MSKKGNGSPPRRGSIESRLDRVEGRLEGVEGRLDRVEGRLGRVETEVHSLRTNVESGFATVLAAIENLGARMDQMHRDLAHRIDNVFVGPLGQAVRQHDLDIRDLQGRVARLEKKRSG